MDRFRRLPILLLACLAAAWTTLPAPALAVAAPGMIAPVEDTSEDVRSDINDAVPAGHERSRHRGHHHHRPPAPSFAGPVPPPASLAFRPSAESHPDTGHPLRNGLGTFYRC